MRTSYNYKNIKAIIGLGNPGEKYYHTRHSIGFKILNAIANNYNCQWRTINNMEYTSLVINNEDHEIILIKPITGMNNSGIIIPWLAKKGIKSEQIVVVHDELEKPFTKLILQQGGSHKGHNGLKSIMSFIDANFWRLKFGIGRPINKNNVGNYVLEPFNEEENNDLAPLINTAATILLSQNN